MTEELGEGIGMGGEVELGLVGGEAAGVSGLRPWFTEK